MNKEQEHSISAAFSDAQLKFIIDSRNSGSQWVDVTIETNEKFSLQKSPEAIRHAYRRYGDGAIIGSAEKKGKKDFDIEHFKKLASAQSLKAIANKENKVLLKYFSANEEILDQVKTAIQTVSMQKVTIPKLVKDPAKKKMTLELMISDVHYGKKSENFNLGICRKRMVELTRTVKEEIRMNQKTFNVERLIIAMLGDMIESYTMHGLESAHACEFGNSQQIQAAIESLFQDLIVPLAATGLKIDIPCVTGNHDRTEKERTMVNPGEANVTWIIYNTLSLLCKQAGFKNISFVIPEGPYTTLSIYGNLVLYEHGDNVRSTARAVLEKLLTSRATQLGKIVEFFRLGHWHEYVMYDRGRIIVNESVSGQDSYSYVKGYNSHAGQTLNSYVETKDRPNCFYRSFPIYLP